MRGLDPYALHHGHSVLCVVVVDCAQTKQTCKPTYGVVACGVCCCRK